MFKSKFTWALALIALGVAGLFMFNGSTRAVAQSADNLTPGMLFGPLFVSDGQHAEVCFSFLSEGSIKATVHFRNFTTGEVTKGQDVSISSGGGGCVRYEGKGQIVGMARGDGAASDWVSPSNALISTMSVFDDNANTGPGVYRNYATVSVIGVPKIWVRGL